MNVGGGEVILSINNKIAEITVSDNSLDKSSTITLRFCSVNSTENRLLLSNEEVYFNIAHSNLTIYTATEVVCLDTGLITFYMLLGPAIRKRHEIKNKLLLFLYAVDNAFQSYAVSSYCLPPEVELSEKQCRFHIISGPRVCFCNANEIFILSTGDVLMKYEMLSNLQLLSCWSSEEWLLCSGLSKSFEQKTCVNSFKVLYVDLIRSSLYECSGDLIPEVYAGMLEVTF